MSAEDYAILVGISVYPNPGFSKLEGPSNDLALIKEWLTNPAGGNVPDDPEHIVVIKSPDPYPVLDDTDKAPPLADAFDAEFRKLMRKRMELKENRVKGRLYLYFSGHGFCNRSLERDSEAALYAANASKDYYDHMFGTQYARIAKGKALFAEVVLVMDCCRDSEVNRRPMPRPYTDTPDDNLAANTRLLTVYAVPKGGKAQESKIKERGDKVHGLLTHALIKALEEAKPTQTGEISSTSLKDFVLQIWDAVCGLDAPPRPEIFPPGSGEILFAARNGGGEVTIEFKIAQPAGAMLALRDSKLKKIAELSASGNAADDLFSQTGPVIGIARNGTKLTLRLQTGFYECSLASGANSAFNVPGDGRNVEV
jgi:hypothetical protein